MGLTWDDIDLDAKTITVSGAAVYDEDNRLVYKDTNKNAASARVLPIMIPALEQLLAAVPDKTGRVTTVSANAMFRGINAVCDANGFPRVGIHGLRHSFVSLAYHLRLSELETMQLGGYSDVQTMRRIYTHLAERDRLKAQNKLSKFFQNGNENGNENRKSQ